MSFYRICVPQDWAGSIDLKDAYLHVPVHPQSRRLLGFKFLDKTYVYKVLSFRLKDSPWVFSRVVLSYGNSSSSPAGHPHILLSGRLAAESQSLLQSHLQATLQLAQNLGFIVNLKKSVLIPQKMPIYLGASLDIPRLIARPVERRATALQSLIQELVASPTVPAFLWQRVLGHLASFVDLVPNCRLLMRPLQLHFLQFFSPLSDSQSKVIPLTQVIKVLCAAWASPARLRLVSSKGNLSPGPEVSRGSCFRSVSSDSFGQHNSRVLHQLSGRNSFPLSLSSVDRAVGVVYSEGNPSFGRSYSGGGQFGGRLPIQREVFPSEWTLNPSIFLQVCQVIVPRPEIDLFASTLNFQLPKYCACCRDPQAWKVDGLSFLWSGLPLYAFPPFSILPTVLEKIVQEGADVALVAPFWPQRPWFLKLLSLLVGHPRALPLLKDLVCQPMSRQPHPRLESLHLTLWPLSGRKESRRAFLLELQFTAEALRESTRAFFEWCNDLPCDPYSASLGQVADFLVFLFDKGLAISTIRRAIASCHRGFQDGSSISESSILSRLCRSFFLKRPPVKTLLPAWSLPVVSRALSEAPFEPLHKASLHCLAIKTAFLVAIASGHRVSTIHALSIELGHIRWEPAGVRLIPRPDFIA